MTNIVDITVQKVPEGLYGVHFHIENEGLSLYTQDEDREMALAIANRLASCLNVQVYDYTAILKVTEEAWKQC